MMWTLIWFGLAMLEAVAILVLVAQVMRLGGELKYCRACHRAVAGEHLSCERALRTITALDTPKAAHGVKKAVAIARGALS